MNTDEKLFNQLIKENSTKATLMNNGCFYYFHYKPTSLVNPKKNIMLDLSPLIFCIGPSNGENLIEGLNFRHLPILFRKKVLNAMDSASSIIKSNTRTIISREKILSIDPQVVQAIRKYNLKNISNCMLLDNKIMQELIEFDINNYIMSSVLENNTKFELNKHKHH